MLEQARDTVCGRARLALVVDVVGCRSEQDVSEHRRRDQDALAQLGRYGQQYALDQAARYCKQALSIRQKALPAGHPDIDESLHLYEEIVRTMNPELDMDFRPVEARN